MIRAMAFCLWILGIFALTTLLSPHTPPSHAAGVSAPPWPRPHAADATLSRAPVLVELFTSEGCSSCPPADALLGKLDRLQPVPNAQVIVLSEHVDYWNDIGWRDPFSAHQFSERQNAYASRFGLDGVYTPQMVVDGQSELVGSDAHAAVSAISNAAAASKIQLALSSVRVEAKAVALHVDAGMLPPASASSQAAVLVAVADESDKSSVNAGENSGRTLTHVAVLRSLTPVGVVSKTAAFSQDVTAPLAGANPRGLRVLTFVQDRPAGRVWGVALQHVSN